MFVCAQPITYGSQLPKTTHLSFLGLADPSNRLNGDTVGGLNDFEDLMFYATTKCKLTFCRSTERGPDFALVGKVRSTFESSGHRAGA